MVELILVMALLIILAGSVLPRLSGFFRGRDLTQEGERFIAVTRKAQDQAISEGVPMTLWIHPREKVYGVREATGYDTLSYTNRLYRLRNDLVFDFDGTASLVGGFYSIHFLPDGAIDQGSISNVFIERPDQERLWISRSTNGFHYEVRNREFLR